MWRAVQHLVRFFLFFIYLVHQEKRRDENRWNSTFQAYSRVLAPENGGIFAVNTQNIGLDLETIETIVWSFATHFLICSFVRLFVDFVRHNEIYDLFFPNRFQTDSLFFIFVFLAVLSIHSSWISNTTGITDLFLLLSLSLSFALLLSICVFEWARKSDLTVYCLKPFKGISTFNKC